MRLGRERREPSRARCGLNDLELATLSIYNGEVQRGLVHTEQWRAAMSELQHRYDQARRAVGKSR